MTGKQRRRLNQRTFLRREMREYLRENRWFELRYGYTMMEVYMAKRGRMPEGFRGLQLNRGLERLAKMLVAEDAH